MLLNIWARVGLPSKYAADKEVLTRLARRIRELNLNPKLNHA